MNINLLLELISLLVCALFSSSFNLINEIRLKFMALPLQTDSIHAHWNDVLGAARTCSKLKLKFLFKVVVVRVRDTFSSHVQLIYTGSATNRFVIS